MELHFHLESDPLSWRTCRFVPRSGSFFSVFGVSGRVRLIQIVAELRNQGSFLIERVGAAGMSFFSLPRGGRVAGCSPKAV